MSDCIACGEHSLHYEKIGGVRVIIHKDCKDTQDVIFDEKNTEEVQN